MRIIHQISTMRLKKVRLRKMRLKTMNLRKMHSRTMRPKLMCQILIKEKSDFRIMKKKQS